jgi:alpha-beta hydrolase superfamily lysophospholipase
MPGAGKENVEVVPDSLLLEKPPDPGQNAWKPGWRDVLARMTMASGVGYLAAAYLVSRWLTRPTPGHPLLTPSAYGLSWEPLHCRTVDRVSLAGWVVHPERPKATVALFHGLHNNRGQTLGRTAFLVRNGYRCVAFDHRAHGESGGRRTSFGFHESKDVIAVLDLVRQRWPEQPVAALGISMGAAALCYAAEQVRHLNAVILESLYHDLYSAFNHRLANDYPPWFRKLARGVIWVTERRLKVRVRQLAPVERIGDLAPAPVLLMTGTADCHATPDEARRLAGRCRGPCETFFVPCASHCDVFETGGSLYQARVLDFLERWLPPT